MQGFCLEDLRRFGAHRRELTVRDENFFLWHDPAGTRLRTVGLVTLLSNRGPT